MRECGLVVLRLSYSVVRCKLVCCLLRNSVPLRYALMGFYIYWFDCRSVSWNGYCTSKLLEHHLLRQQLLLFGVKHGTIPWCAEWWGIEKLSPIWRLSFLFPHRSRCRERYPRHKQSVFCLIRFSGSMVGIVFYSLWGSPTQVSNSDSIAVIFF